MNENFVPIVAMVVLFIGFPWLILHYLTQWKRNKGLTVQDEELLDDLHETARRLDSRLESIERIMAADHPGWKDKQLGHTPSLDSRPSDNVARLK